MASIILVWSCELRIRVLRRDDELREFSLGVAEQRIIQACVVDEEVV